VGCVGDGRRWWPMERLSFRRAESDGRRSVGVVLAVCPVEAVYVQVLADRRIGQQARGERVCTKRVVTGSGPGT
jgi:hypothetical protein